MCTCVCLCVHTGVRLLPGPGRWIWGKVRSTEHWPLLQPGFWTRRTRGGSLCRGAGDPRTGFGGRLLGWDPDSSLMAVSPGYKSPLSLCLCAHLSPRTAWPWVAGREQPGALGPEPGDGAGPAHSYLNPSFSSILKRSRMSGQFVRIGTVGTRPLPGLSCPRAGTLLGTSQFS